MKYRKTAMAAISAGVAAALSLSAAGAATATPASQHSHGGKPKHHTKPKPKPYPQVTGSRLATALLPASAFGDGFQAWGIQSTGGSVRSSKAAITPGKLSCTTFETLSILGPWGDTAGAQDGVVNTSADISSFPSLLLDGFQSVKQFASPAAATTFYNQVAAKYGACQSVTLPVPDVEGGGTEDLTDQSLTKIMVGKYHAFSLIQSDVLSNFATLTFYRAVTVVLAGTNVYTVYETDGTNDPVSPDLIGKLVSRVQGLYPRH